MYHTSYFKIFNSALQVDISIGNNNAVYNTALLKKYLSLDYCVRPLVLVVKKWAKQRGVCDTRNSTLSSYSWTLLVIHFLQICSPPVLPFVDPSEVKRDLFTTMEPEPLIPIVDKVESTEHSLGSLLLGFFYYYGVPSSSEASSFDLFNHSICFTSSKKVSVKMNSKNLANSATFEDENNFDDTTNRSTPWWRVSMQDPLEFDRDLGDVIRDIRGQAHILNELNRGYQIIRN